MEIYLNREKEFAQVTTKKQNEIPYVEQWLKETFNSFSYCYDEVRDPMTFENIFMFYVYINSDEELTLLKVIADRING